MRQADDEYMHVGLSEEDILCGRRRVFGVIQNVSWL